MSELPSFQGSADSVDASSVPILEQTYPLIPPFAYAVILTNPVSRRVSYEVTEVPLSVDEERIYKFIKDILVEELNMDFSTLANSGKAQEYLKREVNNIVRTYGIKIEPQSYDKMMYYIDRDLIGYGPIQPLMADGMIEDISCDGVERSVYVWHRDFESIPTNVAFLTDAELDSFVIKLAQRSGRHISISRPLLDAALPDGSRLQISYGREVTQFGSTFTMRRFRADPFTITDLVSTNTVDSRIAAWYWFLIEHRMSLLIAGGTAAGKTSFLGALAMMLKPDLKVISIEDTAELNLGLENWIPSVAREGFGDSGDGNESRGRISMYDLLRAAMRQRPDFIVVGEIRGSEAYTLFQAISTGHSGMGTIHGDSVSGVISRLESQPMNVPKTMLKSLNLVHIQRKIRLATGKFARRATDITEIVDLDPVTKQLITNKVFARDAKKDSYQYLGRSYLIAMIRETSGLTEKECWAEVDKRETVIRWLVKKQIKHFRDVGAIFGEYYSNPDKVFEKAKRGLSG